MTRRKPPAKPRTSKERRMDNAIAKGKSEYAKKIERHISSINTSSSARNINIETEELLAKDRLHLQTLKESKIDELKKLEDERERERRKDMTKFAESEIDGLIRAYNIENIVKKASADGQRKCSVAMPFKHEFDSQQNCLVTRKIWKWGVTKTTPEPGWNTIPGKVFIEYFCQKMERWGNDFDLSATISQSKSLKKLNDSAMRHDNYDAIKDVGFYNSNTGFRQPQNKMLFCASHFGLLTKTRNVEIRSKGLFGLLEKPKSERQYRCGNTNEWGNCIIGEHGEKARGSSRGSIGQLNKHHIFAGHVLYLEWK